jgi:hypothetical protein
MNERIKEISKQAWEWAEQQEYKDPGQEFSDILEQKFAELIVEECRNVLTEVYRETPLESCGYLLRADEKIAEHFYEKRQ